MFSMQAGSWKPCVALAIKSETWYELMCLKTIDIINILCTLIRLNEQVHIKIENADIIQEGEFSEFHESPVFKEAIL